MATVPYIMSLPSPTSAPARTLRNGVSAIAINAESTTDARAFAKAQYDDDVDVNWDNADVNRVLAATDMTGWKFRLQIVAPTGVMSFDQTVQATGVTAGVKATGVLTSSANYSDTETVTIGSKVYTFQSSLTDVDGHVKIGASEAASIANLHHAINGSGGTIGTDYATSTTPNTQVTAVDNGAHTVTVTAIAAGAAANAIATTETSATASWGATTLTGGIDAAVSGLAALMVVALNADALIANAAFNTGSHVLTVAGAGDSLGDHRVFGYFIHPSADPDRLLGIPGFITAKSDGGSAGSALTMTLVADTYTVPTVAGLLGPAA